MYSASDYRSMARRALKNFWWLAVGVTLLATVLGGGTSSFTVSFQNSDISRYYPEAMRRFTHVLVPVASVLAMGQFVLRGSISIGHDRFCLKLVDGEQAQFEDLFSAFDIFGSAFVLNLLIALKVFAWSLLFVIPGIIAAYRYSMTYPNRAVSPAEPLDLLKCPPLTFAEPDEEVFRCLKIAKQCAAIGNVYCAAMNGANEEAVAAFLCDEIGICAIPDLIEAALDKTETVYQPQLSDILEADRLAREVVREKLN